MDQIGNGADLEAVFGGELEQIRQARHRAVVFDDLADHGGWRKACQRGQVATRLGVACAHHHAARLSHDREYVTRLDDVVGPRFTRYGHLDSAGAIGGGNAGGHALSGFDAYGEGRAVLGAVAMRHQRQIQAATPVLGERQANQTATEARHEINGLRRDEIGGEYQVAFVFAIFFVDQDDHAASF